MELGALVCVPNGAPLCAQCPLAHLCAAHAAGTALTLPRKAAPKARRIEPVTLALVRSPEGVLLQQRPEKGLLAGLWQPVLWEDESLSADEARTRLAALGVVCTPDAAKALLVPLMLVAGDHAINDMASDEEDSWKTLFNAAGIPATPWLCGLGENPVVRAMFVEHLQQSLEAA